MRQKTGNPVGRPRRKIDHDELMRLGGLGLTFQQAAAVMRIPRKTLSDRVHGVEELEDIFLRGKSQALGRISQMLWNHAENGNVIAAIFLAKAFGWRDSGAVPDAQPRDTGGSVTIYLPGKDVDRDE